MCVPMDSPPPYSSLDLSTTNVAILEAAENYDAGHQTTLLENDNFEDKPTRFAFTQKVLATKFLQLLGICTVMGLLQAKSRPVIRFMYEGYNVFVILSVIIVYTVIYAFLVCCHEARRKEPYQQLFLVAYPLSMSLSIGICGLYWEILEPILLSFIYYCVFVFVLLIYNIYVYQTKLECIPIYRILVGVVTQLVMYVFTVPFLTVSPIHVTYPTIIMLLEYAYIIYDLEAMTSKKYWYHMEPDHYIDGTLNLHIDYLNVLYNSKISIALRRRLSSTDEFLDV